MTCQGVSHRPVCICEDGFSVDDGGVCRKVPVGIEHSATPSPEIESSQTPSPVEDLPTLPVILPGGRPGTPTLNEAPTVPAVEPVESEIPEPNSRKPPPILPQLVSTRRPFVPSRTTPRRPTPKPDFPVEPDEGDLPANTPTPSQTRAPIRDRPEPTRPPLTFVSSPVQPIAVLRDETDEEATQPPPEVEFPERTTTQPRRPVLPPRTRKPPPGVESSEESRQTVPTRKPVLPSRTTRRPVLEVFTTPTPRPDVPVIGGEDTFFTEPVEEELPEVTQVPFLPSQTRQPVAEDIGRTTKRPLSLLTTPDKPPLIVVRDQTTDGPEIIRPGVEFEDRPDKTQRPGFEFPEVSRVPTESPPEFPDEPQIGEPESPGFDGPQRPSRPQNPEIPRRPGPELTGVPGLPARPDRPSVEFPDGPPRPPLPEFTARPGAEEEFPDQPPPTRTPQQPPGGFPGDRPPSQVPSRQPDFPDEVTRTPLGPGLETGFPGRPSRPGAPDTVFPTRQPVRPGTEGGRPGIRPSPVGPEGFPNVPVRKPESPARPEHPAEPISPEFPGNFPPPQRPQGPTGGEPELEPPVRQPGQFPDKPTRPRPVSPGFPEEPSRPEPPDDISPTRRPQRPGGEAPEFGPPRLPEDLPDRRPGKPSRPGDEQFPDEPARPTFPEDFSATRRPQRPGEEAPEFIPPQRHPDDLPDRQPDIPLRPGSEGFPEKPSRPILPEDFSPTRRPQRPGEAVPESRPPQHLPDNVPDRQPGRPSRPGIEEFPDGPSRPSFPEDVSPTRRPQRPGGEEPGFSPPQLQPERQPDRPSRPGNEGFPNAPSRPSFTEEVSPTRRPQRPGGEEPEFSPPQPRPEDFPDRQPGRPSRPGPEGFPDRPSSPEGFRPTGRPQRPEGEQPDLQPPQRRPSESPDQLPGRPSRPGNQGFPVEPPRPDVPEDSTPTRRPQGPGVKFPEPQPPIRQQDNFPDRPGGRPVMPGITDSTNFPEEPARPDFPDAFGPTRKPQKPGFEVEEPGAGEPQHPSFPERPPRPQGPVISLTERPQFSGESPEGPSQKPDKGPVRSTTLRTRLPMNEARPEPDLTERGTRPSVEGPIPPIGDFGAATTRPRPIGIPSFPPIQDLPPERLQTTERPGTVKFPTDSTPVTSGPSTEGAPKTPIFIPSLPPSQPPRLPTDSIPVTSRPSTEDVPKTPLFIPSLPPSQPPRPPTDSIPVTSRPSTEDVPKTPLFIPSLPPRQTSRPEEPDSEIVDIGTPGSSTRRTPIFVTRPTEASFANKTSPIGVDVATSRPGGLATPKEVLETVVLCAIHADCPNTEACLNGKCSNPCKEMNTCGKNAVCYVDTHRPTCVCPPNALGNPETLCEQGNCPSFTPISLLGFLVLPCMA